MITTASGHCFMLWIIFCISVAGAFSEHEDSDFAEFIQHILTGRMSHCNVISVQDDYFAKRYSNSDWMWKIDRPIYTMTLNESGKTFSKFSKVVPKTNGKFCLVMVITCKTRSSCNFSNSTMLITELENQGIIRLFRRAIVYIEEETTSRIRPPAKYLTSKSLEYDMQLLTSLSNSYKELRLHLTLLRKLVNATEEDGWLLNNKGILLTEPVFQMLTWSLNWLPGGSPILFDVWSSKTDYWNDGHVLIDRKDLKPGGIMRFVVPKAKLLPFIRIEPDGSYIGIDAELIRIVEAKFKIAPIFIETTDKSYGRFKNNKWTGAVGYVVRKDAEAALGSVVYDTAISIADLRLSPPTILLQGSVACEKPKKLPRWHIIVLPFLPIAWLSLISSFICILVLHHIFLFLETKTNESNNMQAPLVTLNLWLLTFGPALQRSMDIRRLSRRISIRILFGVWLIATLLLSVCYCNILIGKFSVPPKEAPISTIIELLAGDKPWDVALTVKKYIKDSVNPHEKEAATRAKNINLADGLIGVAADNQAYVHFINYTKGCLIVERKRMKYIIYYFSERVGNGYRNPTIRLSTETYYLGPAGWALRGDIDFIIISGLVRYVNTYREIGVLKRTELEYAPRPKLFENEDLKERLALTLDTVFIMFVILFIGYLLSFAVFLLELILNWIERIYKKVHRKRFEEIILLPGYLR